MFFYRLIFSTSLSFLVPATLLAATTTVEFIGPCALEPMLSVSLEADPEISVGELTLQVLELNDIPYIGSAGGFNSIFDTVIGLDALEVLSDQEMRAYGWCFGIDGFEPTDYPDNIMVGSSSRVRWWYGFAHYLNGDWISQCEYSNKVRSEFICGEK